MEQGWHGKGERQEWEALLPLSTPAPLPGASPELDGLLFPAAGFSFPLLASGSIPKVSLDEGKLLPGLRPLQ